MHPSGRSVGSGLALLACLAATPGHAAPPPGECPQPRFTGSAPTEYLKLASPVGADADLAQAEKLFLGEETEILHALPLLEHLDVCAGAHDSEPAHQVTAHDARDAQIARRCAKSRRCGGAERPSTRRIRCNDARAAVEIEVIAVAEQRCPRLAVMRLELKVRRKQQRVLLLEVVGSAAGGGIRCYRRIILRP